MLKVKETYNYWFDQWIELEKPYDTFEESVTWEHILDHYGKDQVLSGIKHGVISILPSSDEEIDREVDEIDDNHLVTMQFDHHEMITNTNLLDQDKYAEEIGKIKAEFKCIIPATPITPKRKPSSEPPRAPKKLKLTPVSLEDRKLSESPKESKESPKESKESPKESQDSDDSFQTVILTQME